jgi:hypothetical protein
MWSSSGIHCANPSLSPECVPNQSSLDFAVYNLDPVARSHQSRPNGPPTPFPVSLTGKGFLSWALAESGAGSTLARGRLVREYEFAATSFVDGGGGLEGLVAAAANAAGEEKDGRGWGLEVTLTLRQLNPEGKSEFGGRKSFETMLAEGKSSASTNLSVTSPGPVRAAPAAQNHGPPQMFARPVAPLPKTASPLRHTVSQPTVPSQPSAGRPLRQVLPAPPPPKTEPPRREAPGSPTPTRKRPYPSSPLAGPPVAAPRTPPRTARDRDHRTPPPRPVDTAPPRTPASPTRATLIKLLKSEGKMSPEMAKRLAQNDFLQKLMKALPPGEVSEAVVSPGRPIREIAAMSSIPPSSAPASEAWAPTPTDTDACYNCKATETVGQWMRKKLKDGSLGLVCNREFIISGLNTDSSLWSLLQHAQEDAPARTVGQRRVVVDRQRWACPACCSALQPPPQPRAAGGTTSSS